MSGPIFSGTVYFAQVSFVTPGQTYAFSDADMATMIEYAQHAIVPLTEMITQDYGPTTTAISPTPITYTANLSSPAFTDSELQGWVNDILSTNSLDPSTSLVVVPCPTGISESSGGEGIGANSGYHWIANSPYAVFGVYATGLTLADQVDQYAMVVSHEIAEAIVDPTVDFANPEVGDPCCENCYHDNNFYRVYFDAFNNYLGTNQQTPPGGFNFAYYTASVVKAAGGGECPAPAEDCDYSPTPQNFYFVADKNTYGHDEVSDTLNWPDAFYLFLDGYSPAGVTPPPVPTGSFNSTNIPGLTITQSSTTYALGNSGQNANIPQRIRFGYDITFTTGSLASFPTAGNPPKAYELDASIMVDGAPLPFSPKLELFLVAGADPYFTNVRDGVGEFYLSQDLRVFTATPAINPVPVAGSGAPQLSDSVAGAYQYVTALVAYLNNQIGYLNPSYTPPDTNTFDPLDAMLPDQTGVLTGDSTVTPLNGSDHNYNFAIARVRLKGSSGHSGEASDTKVFFRLFTTQTFDTDFVDTMAALSSADPNITYPSQGGTTPSFPLPGTDGSGNVNGCSLPFFATANDVDHPTDYQTPGVNNQTIVIPNNHDYAWAFFGCFLNVYDPNNTFGGYDTQYWTAASAHNCLVAQIASADAPIVNANGVIENPENSDKLAQRNLQITPSGNPGYPDTHRVPQTLDVRPSPTLTVPIATKAAASLLGYPDEIMIDWGEVPAGSTASLYWPAVPAQDVLRLAGALYPGHGLTALDTNTLQCLVEGETSYIPIPSGSGGSFAGLITLQLPGSIRIGERFEIGLKRITTRRIGASEAAAGATQADLAVIREGFEWRYVTGTFHMTVPVQADSAILPVDENLLAILKWRREHVGAGSRWYPVLLRYIEVLEQRIRGMGGDPANIPPSPNGYQPATPTPAHPHREHCVTGKVTSLAFDRFGDFEGFTLETERGEHHHYHAHEPELEHLLHRAWADRYLITVCSDPHRGRDVARVVLEHPGRP